MKKTLCWKYDDLAFPIELWQTGLDEFKVVYGPQTSNGLSHEKAATELGESIMHALACDGKLDNS
jgi:hypothetical protein